MIYSRAAIVIMLIPVSFFGYAAYGAYVKSTETGFKRQTVEQNLSELEVRQQALVADLENLNSQRGVEAELRGRYSVGKEGEHMIMLVDTSEVAETESTLVSPPSFWDSILDIVF